MKLELLKAQNSGFQLWWTLTFLNCVALLVGGILILHVLHTHFGIEEYGLECRKNFWVMETLYIKLFMTMHVGLSLGQLWIIYVVWIHSPMKFKAFNPDYFGDKPRF